MGSPEAEEGILSYQPENWNFSHQWNCRQGFSARISCEEPMKTLNGMVCVWGGGGWLH